MSLRRSTRVQTKPTLEVPTAPTAITKGRAKAVSKKAKPAPSKKRTLKQEPETESLATSAIAHEDGPAAQETDPHIPPPTTPNKRRKTQQTASLPPITPTPAAVGFMTTSTPAQQTQTPQPPATRKVKPHHTNAPLTTPGGTGVYSTFEDNGASPTKAGAAAVPTNKNLLETANAFLISVDPSLKPVIDKHFCKVFSPEGLEEKIDPFRALASGIMAQQVSGAAAKSIKNKFVGLFSAEEAPSGFPTPAAVVKKDIGTLRSAGLSQRKAEYIQGLAGKFVEGTLTVRSLMEGSDEGVMEELVKVRGLGRWSVEMFMCFGLKRTDVFSTGDLGVQRGMAAHAGKDVGKLKGKGGKWKYMSEKDMLEISAKFSPYRSLFMWYMWRVEDVDVSAVQDN